MTDIFSIGHRPEDSDELQLMKTLLVLSSSMMAFLAITWGAVYILFDEGLAGSIPLSYSLLTILSITVFAISGRYHIFRFTQLLLPFLLSISLGGFGKRGRRQQHEKGDFDNQWCN